MTAEEYRLKIDEALARYFKVREGALNAGLAEAKEKITEKQETIASLNTEISSIQKAIEEQKNTLKEK